MIGSDFLNSRVRVLTCIFKLTIMDSERKQHWIFDRKGVYMLKSMTGFGRCEQSDGQRKITVEVKAVNHRYLDMAVKMPKQLNFFEAGIRSCLKEYVQRGKVDLYITYEDLSENTASLIYNQELAKEYMDYFSQMAEQFGIENDIRVSTLARCPEVLGMKEQSMDEESIWSLLEKAVKGALEKLVETRILEGDNLKKDLTEKLDGMLAHVDYITARSPELIVEYRQKLEDKVKELLENSQIEEGRIAAEVTLYADKICVDEELVRLRSHIVNVKNILQDGEGVGRKLDFMAQEMNREANTILSKSNDLDITNRAIELKTEIEKIREQIQNIE